MLRINSILEIAVNIVVLLLLAYYIIQALKQIINKTSLVNLKIFLISIAIIHFTISIIFALFINFFNTPDAIKFYLDAVEESDWFNLFNVGSSFISFLIFPLVKVGVRFEVLFLMFATISFSGYIEYLKLIGISRLEKSSKYLLLFFLLPSMHFWTGFLGKEALLFLLMVLVLKKMSAKKYDWKFVLVGVFIFLIRPHVFSVLAFSFGIVILFDKSITKKLKRLIVIFSLLSIFIFVPVFLRFFLRLEEFNSVTFHEYFNKFMIYTKNIGNTSISLSETTIFSRIGYLLFMPLPFLYTIQNELQLIASIENVIYLFMFIVVVINFTKKRFKYNYFNSTQKFALISSILLILLFSFYLYNLGLGNRMRVMFLPYLFYLFIIVDNFKFKKEEKRFSNVENINT